MNEVINLDRRLKRQLIKAGELLKLDKERPLSQVEIWHLKFALEIIRAIIEEEIANTTPPK